MATETKNKFDWKWIIPIGVFGAAVYSAYRAIKAMQSGSTIQLPGGGTAEGGNVGWFETGGGWFCIGFLAAGIIIVLLMRSDK